MAKKPNVSRDTFDRKKDYISLIFQQKRPLLDAELNELQQITRSSIEEAISATLVNGPLADSYDLSVDPSNASKVIINKGVFYYYGQQLTVREDTALVFPTVGPNTEYWTVYLEAWFDYITELDDPAIKDPTLPPTAWRVKQFAAVKMIQGTLLPWIAQGHVSIPLWVVRRDPPDEAIHLDNVADQRFLSAVNYVQGGGKVSASGGFDVGWPAADILLYGQSKRLPAGSYIIPPNATRVIYVDKDTTVLSEEFPVVNRAIVPLARVITDAVSVQSIEDLRPYWSGKEFPEWENMFAERLYPFRISATLTNSFGKVIPKNFVRDLRISNGQYNATYFISEVKGSQNSPTVEVYVSNTNTVQRLMFVIPVPSPLTKDGLVEIYAFNAVTGESAVAIFDLHAICGLFSGNTLEDNEFTVDETPIIPTLVQPRPTVGSISPLINNWREENLSRDYPIQGTSVFLRSHIWDAIVNCGRQDVGYFISAVHLNQPDGDYIELSSFDYPTQESHLVARLERQGGGFLSETFITRMKFSLYGEVAKINAMFADVVGPTHYCFTFEEGRLFDSTIIPCKDFGNLCMGDACIDVRIVGSSRGFGGHQPPIPILIDSNCYPTMVSVSFSEVCWCWPCETPYYYYYKEKEDCVEICPGARDCGVWYLQYRQVGRQDRIIRLQYAYVGVTCEEKHEFFRLAIEVVEVCGDCYTFSYTVFAPNHTVISQLWDFGDGQTSTDVSPKHKYAVAGTYTVTLSVTLDNGSVLTETLQVMV